MLKRHNWMFLVVCLLVLSLGLAACGEPQIKGPDVHHVEEGDTHAEDEHLDDAEHDASQDAEDEAGAADEDDHSE